MREALKILKKILSLELTQGCQNKAMVGGLSNYAPQWIQRSLPLAGNQAEKNLIEEVGAALSPYDEFDLTQRRNVLGSILSRLDLIQAVASPQERPSPASPALKNSPAPSAKAAAFKKISPADAIEQTLKGLKAPVTRLPGIKEGFAKKLAQLGVTNIGDLLELYPRRYNDYSHLKTIDELFYGETVTIIGQVVDIHTREAGRRGLKITASTISDGTASIAVSWFNQPWLEKGIRPGSQIAISGKVDEFKGRLAINSPEYEILDEDFKNVASIRPVYPLTEGINQKWLRQVIRRTVDSWADRLPEHLSEAIVKRWGLMPLNRAIRQIHNPDDFQILDAARYRLTFLQVQPQGVVLAHKLGKLLLRAQRDQLTVVDDANSV